MGHKLNPLADLSGEQVDFPGPPAAQDDASQVSGQDPQSLFGIPVSYQSGAAGTPAPGGEGQGAHDVNQPNQYPGTEPISGVSLGGSGAPGTAGINPDQAPSGGRPVMVSNPNNYQGTAGGGPGAPFLPAAPPPPGPGGRPAPAPSP